MTRFVAVVQNTSELEIAIAAGASRLEMRDPSDRRAAPPAGEVAAMVAAARGRAKLRAVCGPAAGPDALRAAVAALSAAGADEVAVALLPGDVEALAGLAAQVPLIGILFAEEIPDRDVLQALGPAGFAGVKIDVADGLRLIDHLPPATIGAIVVEAHAAGLAVELAGALEAPDVPRLKVLGADGLAFRSALLDPATGGLDGALVAAMRGLVEADEDRAAFGTEAARTDRIFVRDFVVDMEIGAYRSEHGRRQKVRFDVDAEVRRGGPEPRDMRDVFSYDIIMDGIRAIATRGHVELAETVAEEVASIVLAHPRVAGVRVRVEKLELGAGGVGVEIVRRAR